MAQWVDEHLTDPEADEEKICQYVYHVTHIHTLKSKLFNNYEQIDDFAVYCVARVLTRFRRASKSLPAKSINNYIKSVLSLWRADYIREFCTGCADADIADFNVNDFSDYLVDSASQYDYNAYVFNTKDIIDAARKALSKIPRKRCSPEWDNIYISCLLTLENRINKALKATNKKTLQSDPRGCDAIIRSFKTAEPVLFHLPEHFTTYINVLTNQITHAIAAELSYTTASKISVGACLRNMVIAATESEED